MKKRIDNILLEKILEIHHSDLHGIEKHRALYRVLRYGIREAVSSRQIFLTTLFSKIAYLGNRFKIDKRLLYQVQSFRKVMERDMDPDIANLDVEKSYLTTVLFTQYIFRIKPSKDLLQRFYSAYPIEFAQSRAYLHADYVLATSCDVVKKVITATSAEDGEAKEIIYDIATKNDIYTGAIERLATYNVLPVGLQLLDIDIDDQGRYIPSTIIIEPSYLIDVTTIAQCFKAKGWETRFSLLNRFLPAQTSESLVIGNIANYILDEVISNPDLEYSDLQKKLFQSNPLSLALFDDDVVKSLLKKVKNHFYNLKKVIRIEFLNNGITKENVYLEPSFLSPLYGIQGRLDLFYRDPKEKVASIVELKSGKLFRPNAYGLNNNHYTQTLLYELLIKSTFGKALRVNSFVLYSGIEDKHLRYAPPLKYQQKEAIHVRNEIYMDQLALERVALPTASILDEIQPKKFDDLSGFNKTNVTYFHKAYSHLKPYERDYLNTYIAFIAKEQRCAKLGVNGSHRLNGISSVWQNDVQQKKENFNILNHLEIIKNETYLDIPTLTFHKSKESARLSNFRVGDLVILYPYQGNRKSALQSQIFKGTLLSLDEDEIILRLRSKQFNYEIFRAYSHWNIEHDSLDGGFTSMSRSIFEFVSRPPVVRDLWLGVTPPQRRDDALVPAYIEFTPEQQQIFSEVVNAKDYYLLWGPPGTGKTSIMIKLIVKYLITHTDETLLLMAYTNRAVDEICAAISKINDEVKLSFIRVGSRYSTHPIYRANLLSERTKEIEKRSDLVDMIQQARVIVGTTSSMMGKHELFTLKKFDRVLVDEASQLLEPNILGLLSRFERSILIGDHKQLPAVIQQNAEETQINNPELNALGIKNCGDSLFERLYKKCESEGWDWAIGQLTSQGRMHDEIMRFPNHHFYGGTLTTLDKLSRQRLPLQTCFEKGKSQLASYRTIFVSTPVDISGNEFKTNVYEAEAVVDVVQELLDLYNENDKMLTPESIGVITPYRAQIAMIQAALNQRGIDSTGITIDTVERYQGGARDIIIISFCINHVSQFRSLLSLSADGVDRKLNVALTRAKEQIILIGNEENLSKQTTYKKLIDSYNKVSFEGSSK